MRLMDERRGGERGRNIQSLVSGVDFGVAGWLERFKSGVELALSEFARDGRGQRTSWSQLPADTDAAYTA